MKKRYRGVIVEGPDCSGKTALVTRLKHRLPAGWDIRQMTHQAGDQFRRYLNVYLDADRLMLDRAHFSEVVYGDLFRGSKHFTEWELETLNRIAREEFVTVLCTAPTEVMLQRHAARNFPQPATSAADLLAARTRFHEVVEPHAALVVDSDPVDGEDAIERMVAGMVSHIRALVDVERADDETAGDESARGVSFIVVEGSTAEDRSEIAQRLKATLPGWCVTRLDLAAAQDPVRRLMGQYAAARQTIFDGGHLACAATPRLTDDRGGSAALRHGVDAYVMSRGLLIVCERSPHDDDAHVRRHGARHYTVRMDIPESGAALADLVQRAVSA